MFIKDCKVKFQWQCFKVDCTHDALTAGDAIEKVNIHVMPCFLVYYLASQKLPVELTFGNPVYPVTIIQGCP